MEWFNFSEDSRKAKKGHGYFNCPSCGSRQPCEMSQVEKRVYWWGIIPASNGEPVGPEYYCCLHCKQEYIADGIQAYGFGSDAQPPTWRCFKCKNQVAYEKFECPHCGYRLDVGRKNAKESG
jgi:DNA-directed RNA polymerase subunit RPC12/RpoP